MPPGVILLCPSLPSSLLLPLIHHHYSPHSPTSLMAEQGVRRRSTVPSVCLSAEGRETPNA